NHSQRPLKRAHAEPIAPGAAVDLEPPFALQLPSRIIRVGSPESTDAYGVQALGEPSYGLGTAGGVSMSPGLLAQLRPPQMSARLRGVPCIRNGLQSASGEADFFATAAKALPQLVGLDTGRVLLRKGDGWQTAAAHGVAADNPDWHPSRYVVERLLQPPHSA